MRIPPFERVNKLARLGERLRSPEWRRYGYTLLAGKAIGIYRTNPKP